MKWSKEIRKVVHDLYYRLTGRRGDEFVMRCKDVVGHIDSRDYGPGPKGRARVTLHILICQACWNYHRLSVAMGRGAKASARTRQTDDLDLEALNSSLLQRYRGSGEPPTK